MIAAALTYLPPTWEITSAYSFSAPTATMAAEGGLPLPVPDAPEADEHALASSTAAAGARAASNLVRISGTPSSGAESIPPGQGIAK